MGSLRGWRRHLGYRRRRERSWRVSTGLGRVAKGSNKEWRSPQDPDAKIAKMKDGRTHLAHEAEQGVDLETGATVSVTVQDASQEDTATLPETLALAAEEVEAVKSGRRGRRRGCGRQGISQRCDAGGAGPHLGVRSYIAEPERDRRCWQDKKTGEIPAEKRAAQKALYGNRRRIPGARGRRLQRLRGEFNGFAGSSWSGRARSGLLGVLRNDRAPDRLLRAPDRPLGALDRPLGGQMDTGDPGRSIVHRHIA